jgi:hypothetical protein
VDERYLLHFFSQTDGLPSGTSEIFSLSCSTASPMCLSIMIYQLLYCLLSHFCFMHCYICSWCTKDTDILFAKHFTHFSTFINNLSFLFYKWANFNLRYWKFCCIYRKIFTLNFIFSFALYSSCFCSSCTQDCALRDKISLIPPGHMSGNGRVMKKHGCFRPVQCVHSSFLLSHIHQGISS